MIATTRKCLRCQEEFESTHAGHRMCGGCNAAIRRMETSPRELVFHRQLPNGGTRVVGGRVLRKGE